MATILFMFLFGRWSKNEMQWHGNNFVRQRIEKRERKWIGILLLLDLCTVALFFYYNNK